MTLAETIKMIEVVASQQPSVNMIVRNDVFRLNAVPDAKYAAFAWLQREHTTSADSSFIDFSFTFFYVDRLKADKSNEVEIQSTGIQTLNNIIRVLDEYDVVAETQYTFQVFNQRFADQCAGVYCNVTLSVPITGFCAEFFADFNIDFNDDYLTDGIGADGMQPYFNYDFGDDFLIV